MGVHLIDGFPIESRREGRRRLGRRGVLLDLVFAVTVGVPAAVRASVPVGVVVAVLASGAGHGGPMLAGKWADAVTDAVLAAVRDLLLALDDLFRNRLAPD